MIAHFILRLNFFVASDTDVAEIIEWSSCKYWPLRSVLPKDTTYFDLGN